MIYTCYTSHTMHILCKHISLYIYIVIQDMPYRYGSIFYRSRYIIVICKSRWAGKPMDKDKQKWCKISVECLAIDVVDLSLSLGKLIAWRFFLCGFKAPEFADGHQPLKMAILDRNILVQANLLLCSSFFISWISITSITLYPTIDFRNIYHIHWYLPVFKLKRGNRKSPIYNGGL